MGEIRVKSENLFDISSDIHGYIDSSGNFVPNNLYTATDYIEIPPNARTLYCSAITKRGQLTFTGLHIAVYDKNKTLLTYDKDYHKSKISVSVDISLGKYFRADVCDKDYTECMVSFENVPYEPYFLNLPSHQKTSTGWKDIPTHTMTATGWQGELTSQSPLEFRATGQSLLDWRIDGKTSENLWDKSLSYENGFVAANGHIAADQPNWGISDFIPINPQSQYTLCNIVGSNPAFCWYDENKQYISGETYGGREIIVFTPTAQTRYIRISVVINDTIPAYNLDKIMVLKGTYTSQTIPPYEPYGGVGDRTENLFDLNRLPSNTWTTDMRYYMNGGIATGKTVIPEAVTISVNNDTLSVTTDDGTGAGFLVEVKPSTEYRLAFTKSESLDSSKTSCTYAFIDTSETIGQLQAIYGDADGVVFTTDSNTKYVYFVFRKALGTISYSNIMLTAGSTAPATYIPYGYKIPVTVNDTTTNLYTDAQLMDGDSLDYTTDQTSIPITQGNNTLTVGTAVQPSKVFVKFEG